MIEAKALALARGILCSTARIELDEYMDNNNKQASRQQLDGSEMRNRGWESCVSIRVRDSVPFRCVIYNIFDFD